jgi:Mn2+/Fe2+ NRAMP family transporter
MSESSTLKGKSAALLGAAFLMATSAIGPGFITQTTVYTEKLKTSFGFIILCSVILDIVVQLNIWRVISVSGLRAQDLANKLLNGSGYVLSLLIVIGGLAFNIGNIAGAALGLQVIAGIDLWVGAILSTLISLFIFLYKEAGKTLDLFSKVLGFVMIVLTGYIAFTSHPPVSQALYHTFNPQVIDTTAIIILVGGTVGGYISFAGAHRLLDARIIGEANVKQVSNNGVKAIILASSMRLLLFLAALGVVSAGKALDPHNPAASVFQLASGNLGYLIFGIVLWSAAITSVVGSAYTSISFVRTYSSWLEKHYKVVITAFISISALMFIIIGRPINVLVIVGALNGFILPIALAIILLASSRKKIIGNYQHPLWLVVSGWAVTIILTAMSLRTIFFDLIKLWN